LGHSLRRPSDRAVPGLRAQVLAPRRALLPRRRAVRPVAPLPTTSRPELHPRHRPHTGLIATVAPSPSPAGPLSPPPAYPPSPPPPPPRPPAPPPGHGPHAGLIAAVPPSACPAGILPPRGASRPSGPVRPSFSFQGNGMDASPRK